MFKTRFQQGPGECLRGMGRRGPGAVLDTAANVLGMTPEELVAALRAGKSPAQVAEERGVEPQAIVDAARAKAEEMFNKAVADGCLTQEQADSMLKHMAEHEDDFVSGLGGPFGFRHGHRARRHGSGCRSGFAQDL